ncbi:MAG TPA: ABC transporter substrate-binding protein [Solirubrobacterales bacterium]|nr:ABC transporter substrate-binding protein [Solirubrobacterales bacterium]
MSKKSVAVLLAVVLALALAACGSDSDSGSSGTGASEASLPLVNEAPAATTSLDSVSWGAITAPTTLDPVLGLDYGDEIRTNLCDNILRFEADGSGAPAIAKSVANPNPKTFVYEIRPGIKFWNGDEVTAEDVAYSLARNLDPQVASHFATYYGNVKSIEATGPMQVTVEMTRPDYVFPEILGTAAGAIVQKSYAEEKGKDFGTKSGGLMCTGPYELASWTANEIVLKANPNYWDESLQPQTSTLNFRVVPDEDTLTSALLAGDIDGGTIYGSTAAARLQGAKSGTLFYGNSTLDLQLITTTREGALKNRTVRQALSLALPRDGIAETVYANAAVPSKSMVSAIQPWAYARSTFEDYFAKRPPLSTSGDIDKASEMIRDAGFEGEKVNIAITGNYKEVSDVIVETANAVGLDATATTLTTSQGVSLYYDEKLRERYDGFILPWNSNVSDPLENLVYWTPGGEYNYSGYDNPKYTQIVERAVGTADPEERAKLATQALTIVDGDLPWIPIVDQPFLSYMNEGVTGGPVTMMGRNWAQWGAYLGGK